jgi:hypothetical protein
LVQESERGLLPALFHDSTNDAKLAGLARSPFQSPASVSAGGLSLEDAVRLGDFERVARLAVELLRVARQGDTEAVLDIISARQSKPSIAFQDVKFSSHISVIHELPTGIAVEQVSIWVDFIESRILVFELQPLTEFSNL